MLLFLKRLMLVVTAALVLAQNVHGFALLGPRDTWQLSTLGYDPQGDFGDLGGPKNLGEEWRWPIPTITYGFDESFLNFFGLNGMNAASNAFALFNRELQDLAGLSFAQLRAKPRETRRLNHTAQALGLIDVKTATMSLIAEQLGLASAERFTWTIRSQTARPTFTNYVVIQRNFDPFTYKASPYVNGVKYSYQIKNYPAALFAADFVSTSVFPVDQVLAERAPSLSSTVGEDFTSNPPLTYLSSGVYYAALTQDDIGGLKYIYSRDNVNLESAIAGTTNRIVDLRNFTFLQGVDAFNFFSNAATNGPSNILAQFPDLAFGFSTNVLAIVSNVVTTNVFVTNIVAAGLFTNKAALTIISNLDLYAFSESSRTNQGGVLQAQYQGLIITATNSTAEVERTEVYYLTNYPWMPVGSAPVVATNFVNTIQPRYQYEYSNVLTNYKSAVTDLEIETITLTTAGFLTNRTLIKGTNKTSGGFIIVNRATNANLFGYSFRDDFDNPLLRVTNIVRVTNLLANVPLAGFQKRGIHTFTNVTYAAYPILLNAVIGSQVVTQLTSVPVTRFLYSLTNFTVGDFFTGESHFRLIPSDTNLLSRIDLTANGNVNVIVQTIDQTDPGNPQTSTTVIPSPFPLGVVLIYNPNQFVLNGPPVITSGLATNVITTFTDPATGRAFTQLLIYQTNSALFPANPIILQDVSQTAVNRPGVNRIQFKPIPFTDFLSQDTAISTNFYTTISMQDGIRTTNRFFRVAGPDILLVAGDLGVDAGGFPIEVLRSITWRNQAGVLIAPGTFFDGGPGIVVPTATFQYSKVIPYHFNQNPNFTEEQTANVFYGWGSFDSSANPPRVYPEDLNTQVTLEYLEQLALFGRTLRP